MAAFATVGGLPPRPGERPAGWAVDVAGGRFWNSKGSVFFAVCCRDGVVWRLRARTRGVMVRADGAAPGFWRARRRQSAATCAKMWPMAYGWHGGQASASPSRQ